VAPAAGRRTADRISVTRTAALEGRHAGLHSHDHATLVYVHEGRGWYRQGADRWTVGPGTAFFLPPGEVHDASGLSSTRGWLIEFAPDLVGMAADDGTEWRPRPGHPGWLGFVRPACLRAGRIEVPERDRPRWADRIATLATELAERRAGYHQAAVALLTLLLLDVARLTLPEQAGGRLREEPLVGEVLEVIEQRFTEPLRLDEVAAAVSISPRHLSRTVRRVTGSTVLGWLTERRMAEARRLLVESELPVEQVARRVGYADVRQFRRQFRRANGAPPARWRAHARAATAA
jgi:AraC-like DNA-binding protein/quercetin dioxygenase-like cupin family protein